MPQPSSPPDPVDLPVGPTLWDRCFTAAPLVMVGTRDGPGHNLAPKHMAMPFGLGGKFCFICTPRHRTYRNVRATGQFTVSYPRPSALVEVSLAAAPRDGNDLKPALAAIPVFPARAIDGVLVCDAHLWLECELERIVDVGDDHGLIVGRVVAAAAAETARRDQDRDDADLLADEPPLVYLHPGRVAAVRDSRSFPFPAGFTA